jgi:glycosyltransferase involved in cell wall biosynthesis
MKRVRASLTFFAGDEALTGAGRYVVAICPLVFFREITVSAKRIIFITAYNPRDVSKWSGTPSSIFQALTDNSQDVEIKPLRGGLGILNLAARILNKALYYLGIELDCRFSTAYAMLAGAYLTIRLLFVGRGAVLGIAASNLLPYVMTTRDIIYVSDGTFRLICELYPAFKKFPKWLQAQGDGNEARTLSISRFIIYPSEWARNSAQTDYKVPNDRIFQLPFGPNIPDRIISGHFRRKVIARYSEITLLFVSADWKRKNGDMVIDICRVLISAGAKVRAILIGDTPEYVRELDFVEDRGFLRKSDPMQLARLCEAYSEAHFLLLPTIADASPIVFSEAQAFGVPPITFDVGGAASSVVHRETGLLLPLGAPAERFAEEILRYVENPSLYDELSERCHSWYVRKANWSKWSILILNLARYGRDATPALSPS